jgi:hypothetical protein
MPGQTTRRINVGRQLFLSLALFAFGCCGALAAFDPSQIGREVAIPVHLRDGDEYTLSTSDLIDFGK